MRETKVKTRIIERKTIRKKQEKIKALKEKKGFTLVALIVTVIVLLILAGVTIATLNGDNGILTKADEAKLSTELSRYKEELELYKVEKYNENRNFEEETLTAGKVELNYNTKESGETGNIKTIIPDISDEYFEKLEVIKGELLINTQNENEVRVAQRLGIEVNPYDIRDGVLWSSNGNLLLMDENTGSLTIPDSVTAIGEGAFANLEGLRTIIIPSTVKRIERNAFRNNTTLETVIMQEKVNSDGTIEGVEYIGTNAFMECTNLTTVQMSNSVNEFGSQVFYLDSSLKTIKLSDRMTYIPEYMFSLCANLEIVDIPEGVTEIRGRAFSDCSKLTTIKIPKSVTYIDSTAFNSCLKLVNIDLSENSNFSFKDGILLGNNGTEMKIILASAVDENTFTVPDTVTKLSDGQINQYKNITKVKIPASVNSISANFISNNITEVEIDSANETYEADGKAIYTKDENNKTLVRYYANESNVDIEKSIKTIKSLAFYNKELTEVQLPDTLETIESQAFNGCKNLKSLKLGANVKSLYNMSIFGSGIEEIEISEDNPNYSIREGAICNGEEVEALYNKDGTIFISPIKSYGTIITYEIPEGVKKIFDYAFHSQNQMTSVIIPNSLEEIGISFIACEALTSIDIPNSVEKIGATCFSNSTNLRQIRIHKKRDSIKGSPWGCIYGDRAIIWDE